MNEINKTLFIPLYGKSQVSRQHIILRDASAERIWAAEAFHLRGKSKSKWLAYNMAMRARVFDDWTAAMLRQVPHAAVLHIGCGLDSRFERIALPCSLWLDCDLPAVIDVRRKYYSETDSYRMLPLDAAKPQEIRALPDSETAVVVLEGLSMYLTNGQLRAFLVALREKYPQLHILMDIYTVFGARASKVKNPINDVGVTEVYGLDDVERLLDETKIQFKAEHSFTPENLVNELPPLDRRFFKLLFTGKAYGRIYRLIELEA